VRQAAEAGGAVEPAKEPPKILFEAEPFPLLPLLLLRLLLFAACCGAILQAVAASSFGPATRFVVQHGVRARFGWAALWGAVAVFLLLIGVTGHFIRRFRLKHTAMYGAFVEVKWGIGALLINLLLSAVILPLTAGLGLPWIYARYRQSFYHTCTMPGRGGKAFTFEGTGQGVLGRCGLSLLLLPLAIASGGFLLGLITWIWVKWEQSNLSLPDRRGQYRPVEFFGSFWGYLGRWMLGWFLTLITAGIYRPWAKVAEWRWIAKYTQVP